MAWLVTVSMTASYQKIFHSDPRIGFLAQARALGEQLARGAVPPDRIVQTERLIFNNRLDAAVTALLVVLILVLIAEALHEWYRILIGRKVAALQETPYVRTQWSEVSG
jgi:carbon starvation protein